MLLAKCASECFLHQIVSANHVAGQRARVAPKPRDFLFQTMMIVRHDQASSYLSSRLRQGCNHRMNSVIPVVKNRKGRGHWVNERRMTNARDSFVQLDSLQSKLIQHVSFGHGFNTGCFQAGDRHWLFPWSPYPARAGSATAAGSRRMRSAPSGRLPALSWS